MRAPSYFRWDIRVDRTLTAWDRRANAVRFDKQLGLFPVFGLDWRF